LLKGRPPQLTFLSPSSLLSPLSPDPLPPEEPDLLVFLIVCFFLSAGVAFFACDEANLHPSAAAEAEAAAFACILQREQL
jgi:hypothetical protein